MAEDKNTSLTDNKELNIDVEYNANNQEESPLLVAQRYLNIFHQIHIFNDKKKEEFDQSLLDMPVKIKEIVGELPGGRILLEHIDEVAEKKGLKKDNKKFYKKSQSQKSSGKEIDKKNNNNDDDEEDEEEGNSGKQLSLGAKFAKELATSLAMALKDNNVLQTQSQDEIKETFEKFKSLITTAPVIKPIIPQVTTPTTLQEVNPEDIEEQNVTKNETKKEEKTTKQSAPLPSETVDINLTDLIANETLNDPQSPNDAINHLRDNIASTASVSLNNLDVPPVSLNPTDDQNSYTINTNNNQSSNQEDEWEYVDENGNPITDEEWEYVDENGNPIADDGWEYVDENGNPIADDGWEYVDENGNPIAG